jgi:hypothetical protein
MSRRLLLALALAAACNRPADVSHECRESTHVAAYVAVPVVVGGWYAYDDYGWYGEPEASYDDDPDTDPPGTTIEPDPSPAQDPDVPPTPPDDGSDVTLALHPDTAYPGTGCFACRIVCTLATPSGPPAISTLGSSTLSYDDACHAAQLDLVRYARTTWSATPKTCGHPDGRAAR